jgi:hypothetical protein
MHVRHEGHGATSEQHREETADLDDQETYFAQADAIAIAKSRSPTRLAKRMGTDSRLMS